APPPPAPRPQAIAPAADRPFPDGAAAHREAQSPTELDLRTAAQRHDSARRSACFVRVPHLIERLKLQRSWIYDRIHNGTIQVALDAERKLYLFPDTPETLARFRQLRAGKLNSLRFEEGIKMPSRDTSTGRRRRPPYAPT